MRAIFQFRGFSSTVTRALACFLALSPLAIKAQEGTWVAGTGAWNVPTNWSGSLVPPSIAVINNGGTATVGAGESNSVLQLNVGTTGTGNLLVNGGLLLSTLNILGDQAGSFGSAIVTGGTWTLSSSFGTIAVGNSGTGSLLINGPNAIVSQYSVVAAQSAGSHGTVTVSNGSLFASVLGVGAAGKGSLLVNGGQLTSGTTFIGYLGGSGTATVTNGTWTNYGDVEVGLSGTGSLRIDGGLVSGETIRIASSGSGNGQVLLNGGVLQTEQVVAGSGTASFAFNGGTLSAAANSANFLSGFTPSGVTSSGTASINTNGFVITSTLGLGGTGVLSKLGAGTLNLTGSNSYSGGTIVRSGTLAVNGGSINHASRSLLVGNASGENAAVQILNGGRITSLNSYLGNATGATGSATVTSGTWTTGSSFHVGHLGDGSLLVNGGLVSSNNGSIGRDTGVSGTATVSSGTWANSSFLSVGDAGRGTLVINGGLVSSGEGYIGFASSGSGSAVVTSGTWANASTLVVGDEGRGMLSVSGSGVVTSGTVVLGDKAGSQGTLNIGTGGAAGTLQAAVVRGGAGTAQVNFNHTGSLSFAPALDGSLAVTKLGSGTLRLTGSGGYTGGTTVSEGTLLISDVGAGNSVLGTGDVLVEEGATLGGIGTILGDTTLAGTLSPGNSPGGMQFAEGLFLESTAIVQMELASLASFDQIGVDGLLTYNGTLSITLLGGYLPDAGDMFALFDAGMVAPGSNFTTIVFDEPGYTGTFNAATGVLTIVPEPSAAVLLLAGSGLLLRRRTSRGVRQRA